MEIRLDASTFGKLNVNPKSLFQNVLNFNWGSAITDIVGHEKTKETLAFQLLFKSMQTTNLELSKKYWQEELNKANNLPMEGTKLEVAVSTFFEEEVVLTANFFKNVIHYDQSFLRKSLELFKEFIKSFVEEPVFTDELTWEYYKNYKSNIANEFILQDYSILVDYFNNPVKDQNDDESVLLEHYKRTRELFSSPFKIPDSKGESLKDLYVNPNFSFFWRNLKHKPDNRDQKFFLPKARLDIHDYIDNFFLDGNQHPDCKSNYNMLFILGQPGQGKTSLCCKIVYDYLERSNLLPFRPIFFVKIRDLVATDFVNNTFDTLRSHLQMSIDFEKDTSVLILDGLDEAYMSGGIKDRDLQNLFWRLSKCAQNNSKLKIILTSRFHYLKTDDSCLEESLVIQIDEFSDNQILKYAKKFESFYPKNDFISKVPAILNDDKFDHLGELIRQPVLIYFIAVANVSIEEDASKTIIYNKIFNRLAERSWDQRGQLDYILPSIREDKYSTYLRMFIRNIAFEIHQSPELFIKSSKIGKLKSTQQFVQNCFNKDLLDTNFEEVTKYLLISFYFQESKNQDNSDTAIEFFHNSLWEYLTAEYIWEELKKNLNKRNELSDIEYLTTSELFIVVNDIVRNKQISRQIYENIELLIQNDSDSIKNIVFDQLNKSFRALLEKGMLLEYDSSKNRLSAFQKLVEISKLLWFVLRRTHVDKTIRLIVTQDLIKYLENDKVLGREDFKNIDFSMNSILVFNIISSNFKDCNINSAYYLMMHDCTFSETLFYRCGDVFSKYYTNHFKNVVFENCIFSKSSNWFQNTFENVKFKDVYVPSKNWLETIVKNNGLDKKTLFNHRVERISATDERHFNGVNFVIRYIAKK